MKRRIGILIVLMAATILYRFPDLYLEFFTSSIVGNVGLDGVSRGGHMVVNSLLKQDYLGRTTPAYGAGLRENDRIVEAYDGHGVGGPINGLFDYGQVIRRIHFGESWTLAIERGEGVKTRVMRLNMPPILKPSTFTSMYSIAILLHFLIPLLAIVTAFFVGFMRPDDNNAFRGCLLFLSFAVIFGVYFAAYPPSLHIPTLLYYFIGQSFLIYLFMSFFLLFPSPSIIERKMPWLRGFFLIFSAICWVLNMVQDVPDFYSFECDYQITTFLAPINGIIGKIAGVGSILMFIVGVASLFLNTFKASTRDELRRMIILLAGTVVGLMPLFCIALYQSLLNGSEPPLWLVLAIAVLLTLFPLSFAYVVVVHRVFGIKVMLRRGLQYALLSQGFHVVEGILLFVAFYFGAHHFFSSIYRHASPITISATTVILTLGLVSGLKKVNQPIMQSLDRRFFRDAVNAQEVLTALSRAVRKLAAEPERLIELVTDQISDSLHPAHVAVFLRRNGSVYQCVRLKQRFDGNRNAPSLQPDASQLILQADAFIPRQFEGLSEPEAIELYPEGPTSTTTAIIPTSSLSGMHREGDLIQRLNTRLLLPLKTSDTLLGFISLGEKLSEEPYTKDNKKLLLTVAEQTSIALDYAQLVHQVAEQEKLKRELEIAQEVQSRLFPQDLPPMKTLEYVSICKAARGVAGDYYDFLKIGADKLGMAIGDVSGKGIGAALLMASLQALLRSHAQQRGDDVGGLIGDMNKLMCASTDSNKYATFFYALYDDASRAFTYVNAGHNPPMLFRPATTTGTTVSDDLPALTDEPFDMIRLCHGGMVIGMFESAAYEQETVYLQSGDILVFFTDGVSEAMNVSEEEFGEQRISKIISSWPNATAKDLSNRVLQDLAAFVGDAPQYDDVTLIVARVY